MYGFRGTIAAHAEPAPPLRAARSRCCSRPPTASAHPERTTFFPDHTKAERPKYPTRRGDDPHGLPAGLGAARSPDLEGQGPEDTAASAACACASSSAASSSDIQEAVDAAKTRRPHPHLPGRLHRGAAPQGHVQRPEVLARGPEVLGADERRPRRERQGPDLPVPLGLQELAQPHPDHGRRPDDPDRECDQKCNLQLEGIGKQARGRADRRRPPQARRRSAPTAPTASSSRTSRSSRARSTASTSSRPTAS